MNQGNREPERLVANLARALPTRLAVAAWAFRAEFRQIDQYDQLVRDLKWHVSMRFARFAMAVVVSMMVGCEEEQPGIGRVVVSEASIIDDGTRVHATIHAEITAGPNGLPIPDFAGVVTESPLCERFAGFHFSRPVARTNAGTPLAPNETRSVTFDAWGGNHPECDSSRYVARCGERVLLVLSSENDGMPGGSVDTVYGCQFPVPPSRSAEP